MPNNILSAAHLHLHLQRASHPKATKLVISHLRHKAFLSINLKKKECLPQLRLQSILSLAGSLRGMTRSHAVTRGNLCICESRAGPACREEQGLIRLSGPCLLATEVLGTWRVRERLQIPFRADQFQCHYYPTSLRKLQTKRATRPVHQESESSQARKEILSGTSTSYPPLPRKSLWCPHGRLPS